MNTFEHLQKILFDEYKLAPEQVTPDARLEDLEIDSLGLMELLFKIEDEFPLRIPATQVPLSTVADVVAYIDTLVAEQNGAASGAGAL